MSIGPYTRADAEARLAEVSGDPRFARDFFARYIEGREAADYARLLARAGIVLGKRNPDARGGARSHSIVGAAWCASGAGPPWARLSTPPVWILTIRFRGSMDGESSRLWRSGRRSNVIGRGTPSSWPLSISGVAKTARVTLVEDPHLDLVPIESAGGVLTPDQRRFREGWLN